MNYSNELIERIKDSNNIVDVIGQYVTLKRKGTTYFGLCPFHREKTPSFAVSETKQVYHCFGCHNGGTVIQFLQNIENISFREAIEILAERARIELPKVQDTYYDIKQEKKKEMAYKINEMASNYFMKSLVDVNDKTNKLAQEYVKKRKLNKQMIIDFKIGYSKIGLVKYLVSHGIKEEDIITVGLAYRRDNNSIVDRFINRLMFTLKDIKGRVIGFTGRKLDDNLDVAKYINTNENIVYSKGNNLYGLDIAKNYSRNEMIIVEGNMDAISLHQRDIRNVVASMGTALTEKQARLILRYTKNVKIAYDSDAAGEEATIRGLDILDKLGADVRVVKYEGAKDPDEYIIKFGKESFLKQVKNSISLFEFKLENVSKKYNLENISDKVKFMGEVLELLLKIRNSAERDIYIKEISKKYGISVESIYLEIEKKEKNIKTDGISAEAFLENVKKETEKDLENDKEKAEKIKKYTEELILIKVLIYNKSARVNFKNNISLSVISDELNRKTIDNIIQNIDLDEVKLIDKLLLDEEISKKITEILSRDDNIFKSDMNIEEKDPMIVLKSFEKRTLEERMKMIEKSLVLMERTEENKEIILELEKEFKEIISKLYNK
jgi:hypothetical protein